MAIKVSRSGWPTYLPDQRAQLRAAPLRLNLVDENFPSDFWTIGIIRTESEP
jgi:hypothetical protein